MAMDKAQTLAPLGSVIGTVGQWLQTVLSGGIATPPASASAPAVPRLLAIDHDDIGEVVLVGPMAGALCRAAGWLGGNGAQVLWEASVECAFNAAITRRSITHLLVDVDRLGGIMTLLEPLLALREARPDLVVILVSHDFLLDDYGTERLFLCDASLRAPLSFAALEVALSEAAWDNNRLWKARRAA